MKWIARSGAAAALLGVAVFGGWGCTGDNGNELTLEEYFRELDILDNESSAEAEAAFDDVVDTTDIDAIKEAYDAYPGILGAFIEGLEDLDPPDEAEEVHERAVGAAREFGDALRDALTDLADVTSLEELGELGLGEEFTEAEDGFTTACLDLEELAVANSIDVDLDCGGG
jgi:hypothetical protein